MMDKKSEIELVRRADEPAAVDWKVGGWNVGDWFEYRSSGDIAWKGPYEIKQVEGRYLYDSNDKGWWNGPPENAGYFRKVDAPKPEHVDNECKEVIRFGTPKEDSEDYKRGYVAGRLVADKEFQECRAQLAAERQRANRLADELGTKSVVHGNDNETIISMGVTIEDLRSELRTKDRTIAELRATILRMKGRPV